MQQGANHKIMYGKQNILKIHLTVGAKKGQMKQISPRTK